MIKRLIKKLGEKIGLTEVEVTGILFFAVMLLVGLSVRYYGNQDAPLPSFDYSKQDSLFLRLRAVSDSLTAADTINGSAVSSPKKTKALLNRKININLAAKDELILLPGIGDKMASNIIEYRTKSGRFKKPEDIMEVKGIGPAKFEKMKDFITL